MAAPLNTAKATVDLAAPGVEGSRIRRNPPPENWDGTAEALTK